MKRASTKTTLPAAIDPMLAKLGKMPAGQQDYHFEIKWDGIRAVFFADHGGVRIFSRNQKNITHSFPEITGAASFSKTGLVFDGEIVAFNEQGIPDFGCIQTRIHVSDAAVAMKRSVCTPVTYFVFDLLYKDFRSMMDVPFAERRELLKATKLPKTHWQLSQAYEGEGDTLLEAAKESQLEGIIAKKSDSTYQPGGRTSAWTKIKIVQNDEFVIGGWTEERSGTTNTLGAILLGYYTGDGLRYIGKVGTGFTERTRRELLRELNKEKISKSPFSASLPRGKYHFVRPRLVAQIEYRGWTPDGKVRQGAFKGLRIDKQAKEVRNPRAEVA